MTYRTEFDGVIFDEGLIEGMRTITRIDTALNSVFGQDQLKSLNDLKRKLAAEVRSAGGNCLADFKYGQRNGTLWQQLWSVDNVLWFGSGVIGHKAE